MAYHKKDQDPVHPRARVPDYNDEGFDKNDFASVIMARRQRARERAVADQEMRNLQQAIHECVHREGVNATTHCRPLTTEYVNRLANWRGGVAPMGDESSLSRLRFEKSLEEVFGGDDKEQQQQPSWFPFPFNNNTTSTK
eukprot:TRINITY_DN1501_c0_g1_i1.p1 TRINITY_DN1501_c0_g1~~TRINITY_DN1501_c0_g1_i1.p1  ORF type:complete len:140 (-),score=33.34 TRINITY_DN1501_c0_g1_i1:29-448(-)